MSAHYDAIIIGGGPAGSAAAIELGRRGRHALLLERQEFPRFHIGESLLPASNRIFQTLGLEERIRAQSFVEKRGASFATEDNSQASYIDFTACSQVAQPVTYQVLRSHFDEILLERAAEEGAAVRQGCHVRDVSLGRAGVTVLMSGARGDSRARGEILVDASGQAGFLSKRLGLRRLDPKMKNVAVYAHFEGVPRPPGDRAGDIRIISRRDMSWIWMIPLSEMVTSVGAVLPRARRAAEHGESAELLLERHLNSAPAAREQMREARRLSAARFEADFCYAPRTYAGDRWLLAGDAGSFLDPVFSSGVFLALESGLEAAQAIDRALRTGTPNTRAFAAYHRTQRRRYKFFRRLVRGFYEPPFRDLFFTPTNRFGMLDAIIAALAGTWRPPLHLRLKLEVFFALVQAQRFLPLAPRSHSG